MSTGRHDDDRLLDLIEQAYAAAEDSRQWEPFLVSVTASLHAVSAHLLHHDLTTGGSVTMNVRLDPDAMRLYNEHFHSIDPFALSPVARAAAPGVCATDEMFVQRADLIRSEYFNDFALKFDFARLMSTLLDTEKGAASALTVLRGRRHLPFDTSELRFLQALSPHVRRALQIHQRIHSVERERTAAVDALDALRCAMFLVDGEARVLLANRKGQALLAARDGLATDRGCLCAMSPGGTKTLRDHCGAVATTRRVVPRASGGAFRIDRPGGRPSLHVLVTPVASSTPMALAVTRVAAAVFVTDPSEKHGPSEALLRQAYELTPAESQVAALIAIGRSLAEIAAERGSALETVRRQNKQILAKTGARHRSELVHVLLTTLPISLGT